MNNNLKVDSNSAAAKQLHENWGWYMALGLALVVLGGLAAVYSYASTIFSVMYLGAFAVFVGVVELVRAFKVKLWGSFFLHIFLSVLYLVAGFYLFMNPSMNALALTLLMAIFFVVAGVLKMVFAFFKDTPHKLWVFVSGLVSLLLGILLWRQWPVSGTWAIGLFVGIDVMFVGFTWIMLALAARDLKK